MGKHLQFSYHLINVCTHMTLDSGKATLVHIIFIRQLSGTSEFPENISDTLVAYSLLDIN